MRLKEAVETYKQPIEQALKKIFDEKISEAGKLNKDNVKFYENLKEFVLRGGKRLRPITLIMAYSAVKEPTTELNELIRTSTCVELLHNSTLIHDDIIDQDELRRGGPTFHTLYGQLFEKEVPHRAKILGIAMGILGGDELFNIGFETLLTAKFDRERVSRALEYYVSAYREVVNGELLDLMFSITDYEKLSEEEYLKMIRLKTAALFEKSICIGSVLAGIDEKTLLKLREYAVLVAEAFQIQDDILGIYGDEKVLGKPIGSDLREGKATLLVIKAIRTLNDEEKRVFLQVLGKENISLSEVKKVRKILREKGILEYVRKVSYNLAEEAKKIISKLSIRDEAKEYFVDLADYVIQREY